LRKAPIKLSRIGKDFLLLFWRKQKTKKRGSCFLSERFWVMYQNSHATHEVWRENKSDEIKSWIEHCSS
jgi:hypothetical protein